MTDRRRFSGKKLLIAILLAALLTGLFLGIQWATFARPPLPEALAALESDAQVDVVQDPWLTSSPTIVDPQTGLIFYPGGRIDPRGYASLMHTLAAEGYLVVIPEMPINMAVFNPDIADEIIASFPGIKHWVIGGHSVGGTMAARYASIHLDVIEALVFWASYPASSADLSRTDLAMVNIFGSHDPQVNDESIAGRKHLLPEDTVYVRIAGGDHHQFGSYEIKPTEQQASISRPDQHQQILQATLALLIEVAEQ